MSQTASQTQTWVLEGTCPFAVQVLEPLSVPISFHFTTSSGLSIMSWLEQRWAVKCLLECAHRADSQMSDRVVLKCVCGVICSTVNSYQLICSWFNILNVCWIQHVACLNATINQSIRAKMLQLCFSVITDRPSQPDLASATTGHPL